MKLKKNVLFKSLGGLITVCGAGIIGAICIGASIENYNTPTFDAARLDRTKKMLAITMESRTIQRNAAWDECKKSVHADATTKPLLERMAYYENLLYKPESIFEAINNNIEFTKLSDQIDALVEEKIKSLPNIREIDERIKNARHEIEALRRDSIEYEQWMHASKIERVKKNWALMQQRKALANNHYNQLIH